MSEYAVHKQIADYMNLQYPNILFRSDHSGVRVSKGTAIKMKALQPKEPFNAGFPDLFIATPRKGKYGLFIEIKKKELVGVYRIGKNKGQARYITGKPSRSQIGWLSYLDQNGYAIAVATGFEEAKTVIDEYLR